MDQTTLSNGPEPEPEGGQIAAQGSSTLLSPSSNEAPSVQVPSILYGSNQGSMPYSQGQGRGLSSGQGMTQFGNAVPNVDVPTESNVGQGRGQFQDATWSVAPRNGAVSHTYINTTQPINYNFQVTPPARPANYTYGSQGDRRNGDDADSGVGLASHATGGSKIPRALYEGKLPMK